MGAHPNRHRPSAYRRPQEGTTELAIRAARRALATADVDPRRLGLVILATATANHQMPSSACQVQNAIGAAHAGAFDLNAGCSGFVYALALGHQAIAAGEHDLVLVIGAETMSNVVDWNDRSTAVLFGDGAGAVVLAATEGESGVLSTVLGSDGSGDDLLIVPAGGSARPTSEDTVAQGLHCLRMNGRQVFRFAARVLPQATQQAVAKAGLRLDDVDWIIPHQANMRIIESAARRLRVGIDRFVINLDEYGNTSAASVPIALCEAIEDERIRPGHNLVLVGFGAGLTWAAVAMQWAAVETERPRRGLHRLGRWFLYRWANVRTGVQHRLHRMTGRVTIGRTE